LGVLAAVIGAKTTGQGSHVDVAMTDAVLAHNIFPLVATLAQGKPAPRGADLLTGGVPCYAVYRTADDRYLAVGALEPKFWQVFCAAIERPDLAPFGLATGSRGSSSQGRTGRTDRFATARPLAGHRRKGRLLRHAGAAHRRSHDASADRRPRNGGRGWRHQAVRAALQAFGLAMG
jgi:hypothetical protein